MKKSFLVPFVIMAMACSVVPLTGRKQFTAIPSAQMLALSKESYNEVLKNYKLSQNATYTSMVTQVGRNVTQAIEEYMRANKMAEAIQGYQWQFNVLQSDEINAWCLPGGEIAFYEGIMPICRDETGVAVVMSHEIAHAIAKHGNERMSQQLAFQLGGVALSEALRKEKELTQQLALIAFGVGSTVGVLLPYSRTHEKEADKLGLYFMAMAGYNPEEAITFWTRMSKQGGSGGGVPEFLSTHPATDERIKAIRKNMPEAMKYYKNPNKGKKVKIK